MRVRRVTANGGGVSLGWWKCFGTRQTWWLHNAVNVSRVTELYTFKRLTLCYVNVTSFFSFHKRTCKWFQVHKVHKGTGYDFSYQPDWSNRDWIYLPVWSNSKLRWNRLNKSSQDIRRHQVMRDDEPKRQEIARLASAQPPGGGSGWGAGRGTQWGRADSWSEGSGSLGRPRWPDIAGQSTRGERVAQRTLEASRGFQESL